MVKKLVKSISDKKICGVCGGFAEYFDIDATIFRIAFVVSGLCTAILPAFLLYLIVAAIMPKEKKNKELLND